MTTSVTKKPTKTKKTGGAKTNFLVPTTDMGLIPRSKAAARRYLADIGVGIGKDLKAVDEALRLRREIPQFAAEYLLSCDKEGSDAEKYPAWTEYLERIEEGRWK